MIHIIRVLIGGILLFAGLASLVGGVNNAATVIAVLAVCTAGIGGGAMVMLAWAIGWAVVETFEQVTGRKVPVAW
jgi:hypothetical protein